MHAFFKPSLSYEAALANAMSSVSVKVVPTAVSSGEMGSHATVQSTHPQLRETDPQPSQHAAGSSTPTRTFVTSADIIQQRRQVRTSPTPPARSSSATTREAPWERSSKMPVPLSSSSVTATSAVPHHEAHNISTTSEASTVSDAGTGISAIGVTFHRAPVTSLAPEQATLPKPSHAVEATTTIHEVSREHHAVADTHQRAAHGTSKRHGEERNRVRKILTQFVSYLKWRAKWYSPFAATLRGQIQEARNLMQDSANSGISAASLQTQMNVWQTQLSQYMLSQQSTAKIGVWLKSLRTKRSGGDRVPATVRTSTAMNTNATRRPPPEVVGVTEGQEEAPAASPKRGPVKMLRRGDGLARHGVTTRGQASSSTVQESHSGTPAETVSRVTPPVVTVPTVLCAPPVPKQSRESATRIAEFLAQVISGNEDRASRTKANEIPRLDVTPEVLAKRREQLLHTLFQSPDRASPSASLQGSASFVPRWDVDHHGRYFALPGDPKWDAIVSDFGVFQGKPRTIQKLIEAALNAA